MSGENGNALLLFSFYLVLLFCFIEGDRLHLWAGGGGGVVWVFSPPTKPLAFLFYSSAQMHVPRSFVTTPPRLPEVVFGLLPPSWSVSVTAHRFFLVVHHHVTYERGSRSALVAGAGAAVDRI